MNNDNFTTYKVPALYGNFIQKPPFYLKSNFNYTPTKAYLYTPKGNFLVQGCLYDVNYILKNIPLPYFGQKVLYTNEKICGDKKRSSWILSNGIIERCEFDSKKGQTFNNKKRYFVKPLGSDKTFSFRRLPRKWIPEFDGYVKEPKNASYKLNPLVNELVQAKKLSEELDKLERDAANLNALLGEAESQNKALKEFNSLLKKYNSNLDGLTDGEMEINKELGGEENTVEEKKTSTSNKNNSFFDWLLG